jgi:hypothetical protein
MSDAFDPERMLGAVVSGMNLRAPASALLAASLLAAPGCGEHACTLIGCIDATTLTLLADTWPAGQYIFAVEADGSTASCPLVVPVVGNPTCPTAALAITATADGSPALLRLEGAPESLVLRVERDGAVVFEATVTPERTSSYPNGEDCGPECENGQASVTVSP